MAVPSLVSGREKRSTAGAKMSKLLEGEEEDDFYKTTYGGFAEEAEDGDYASEKEDSDAVDSDFDIDEHDEVKSDHDDDDAPKRKKAGVDTKAYKEPKKPKTDQPQKKPKPRVKPDRSQVQIYHSSTDRKALRRTTVMKTQQVEDREKEREAREKMLKDMAVKKNVSEVRRLTQEELLEEAVITEEMNLRSLEIYRQLELEKKKCRVTKKVYRGPIIRYQSLTMPLLEEIPMEIDVNVDGESGEGNGDGEVRMRLSATEKCSRTFITFTDDNVFKDIFPHQKRKPAIKHYCPVTRLPAKYFDPVTKTPYANAQAFKIIREAYAQYLEAESSSTEGKRRSISKSQVHVVQKS